MYDAKNGNYWPMIHKVGTLEFVPKNVKLI